MDFSATLVRFFLWNLTKSPCFACFFRKHEINIKLLFLSHFLKQNIKFQIMLNYIKVVIFDSSCIELLEFFCIFYSKQNQNLNIMSVLSVNLLKLPETIHKVVFWLNKNFVHRLLTKDLNVKLTCYNINVGFSFWICLKENTYHGLVDYLIYSRKG